MRPSAGCSRGQPDRCGRMKQRAKALLDQVDAALHGKIPPQPLDSYKQVESVPAEPRPVAPPGATTPR